MLAEAEVIFGQQMPENVIRRAPRLKWIQAMSAGVNRILTEDVLKSPVKITTIGDVRAKPVAEWAFGLMVTLVWLYIEILRLLAKIANRR